jgi:histidinol-phosphate/aromatic aminotransferase/cobyric acid decarboxylase-like protein
LDAIAHRVRLERLRLYRMLRKLNFLSPFPSDAGYVLAEVTRGDRDEIALALSERGISVYAPPQHMLARTLRFSAISPAATRQLQTALVDISRTVLG